MAALPLEADNQLELDQRAANDPKQPLNIRKFRMPKLTPSRLDGIYGMRKFSAEDLHRLADETEAEIGDPNSKNDPRYLQRWATQIRKLAEQKEKSIEHKAAQE